VVYHKYLLELMMSTRTWGWEELRHQNKGIQRLNLTMRMWCTGTTLTSLLDPSTRKCT